MEEFLSPVPSYSTSPSNQSSRRRLHTTNNAVSNQSKLPSYTEIHTTSPIAAGLPILEIVKKLEEEKILSREDRAILKDALYSTDNERRESVIKALCDVELSSQSRFAIRRLKTVIYQNGAGEISSKIINNNNQLTSLREGTSKLATAGLLGISSRRIPESRDMSTNHHQQHTSSNKQHLIIDEPIIHHYNPPTGSSKSTSNNNYTHNRNITKTRFFADADDDDEEEEDAFSIANNINQVVGDSPQYSGGDNFHVLSKVMLRLQDILTKVTDPNKLKQRKFVVLVGSGSYNPLTRMHLRTFFLAKQYLEVKLGYLVLGSLLSPAHSVTVRERYRTNPSEIIPSPHRLAVAQLLVQNSKWLSIDPWEITRRRAMDYLSLLEHVQAILSSQQQTHEIKVMFLCKANMVPKISPQALRSQSFGCVSVCRAAEADILRQSLTSKWNGLISVVEDNAILDASFDMVTSRKVRDKIKAGESVDTLVGARINDYVLQHRLGAKMTGQEEWSKEEKELPKIASRPAEPTLRSQQPSNSLLSTLSASSSLSGLALLGKSSSVSNSSNNKRGASSGNGNGNNGSYYLPSWLPQVAEES